MLEPQRGQMLEAMGVRILHSRFQMAGAKKTAHLPARIVPARQTVQSISATPVAGIPLSDTLPSGELSGLAAAKNLVATISLDSGKADSIRQVSPLPEKTREKTVKFRYRTVAVGKLLMLVDQPTLEWLESKKSKVFFTDIYFFLTGKIPETWAEAGFDWPPSKQFPYANDRAMARQALQSFLQQQIEQSKSAWLLVWGVSLAENFLEAAPEAGEVGFLGNTTVLPLDSLQHYWQFPASKHLLWQLLQTVKKSVAAQKTHG